jgi:hypothetical protein
MQVLAKYYTSDKIKEVLLPVIAHNGKDKLSLRALDWLVTNYSKKRPIIYKIKPVDMPEKIVNMYTEYKTWLWKYRRSHFDPFRRRDRLTFHIDGVEYTTTVGQLNFMYWASRYGVLAYARDHLEDIEKDHAAVTKNKKDSKDDPRKRKRRQLSALPSKKVLIFGEPVTVSFNPGGKEIQ